MANVFIEENILQGWADTVREKTGTTDKMLPSALLQQTQTNWGTGGGSGGDGAMGVTTIAFFLGYPSTQNSNPITGNIYLDLPEDAIVEWANFYCKVQNNAGSSIGTILFTPNNYTVTESAISSLPGYNEVVFKSYSITNSSAGYYYGQPLGGSAAVIKFPNAYMENNIIHAGPNCKGLFVRGDKAATGVNQKDSLYFEGVDLRGSQVQTLPSTFGNGHTELKKIWLSDVFSFQWSNPFDSVLSQLEEFHFATTTPPTLYSYRNLNALPTTCKIYVPAGSLSAYTSAQYYPDPTTYTYIEE